jgi:hypothetical protein
MRMRLSSVVITLVAVVTVATIRLAAQPAGVESLPGPLACYVYVTGSYGLDQASAKSLCIGATSIAPAQCFDEVDNLGIITDAQAVQLCAGATSDVPVRCISRLTATSGYVDANLVQFCAALRWPFVPAPTSGSPVCLDAAQYSGLADDQALSLCRGAKTTEPVACVERGRLTGLADGDLVDLCTTVVPFPLPQ